MFTEIADLMSDKDVITLVLTKANGILAVSVMPKKIGLKDEAKDKLSPIVLKGTPEELDREFITTIQKPIERAVGLLTNMAVHEKSVEEVKAKSKAEDETRKKENAEKKAFTDKMQKVETLYKERKFPEAALLLKQVSEMSGADKKQCETLKIKIDVELNSGTLFVD